MRPFFLDAGEFNKESCFFQVDKDIEQQDNEEAIVWLVEDAGCLIARAQNV